MILIGGFSIFTERRRMKKDTGWKSYLRDNNRYADIINAIGCAGKQLVKASDLTEADTEEKGKARDNLRRVVFGMNFAIIGIESQEEVDYKFPLRMLSYDVEQYQKEASIINKQVRKMRESLDAGEYLYGFRKKDRLHPQVTIALYSGKEPWDGPRNLKDILDMTDIPIELQSMIQDYRIHIVDIRRMEDTERFHTDVKHVFDMIRCSEDKQRLLELIMNNEYYKHMDEDALELVTLYTNSKELIEMQAIEGEGGKKDMCKAIQDLIEDSKAEGREEGIVEGLEAGRVTGREEGIEEAKLTVARNLLGVLSDELIAEKVGLPLEKVKELYTVA